MASSLDQLQALRGLKENWDGYGGAAPNGRVVELAQEFVGLIQALLAKNEMATQVIQVSPTRIGGVLLEWEDAAYEHEIEFSPDGSIGFLHRNKSSDQIETRRFVPEQSVVAAGFLKELCQLVAA